MSMTSSLFHIVINTYRRQMSINPEYEEDLYRYIWHYLKENKCKLLRIGGIENHIHLLVDIHPTMAVAKMMEQMKRNSSLWMKNSGMFPLFVGWGKEYFGFSKSTEERDKIINYIKNQKEHHKSISFEEEIKGIVESENREWDDLLLT